MKITIKKRKMPMWVQKVWWIIVGTILFWTVSWFMVMTFFAYLISDFIR